MDELLTPDDVARVLSVTRQTVYVLIRDGLLPVVRLSARAYRVRRSDLDDYISSRRVPPEQVTA